MGKVVVVTSGKGGVGKTTSTAALGAALAQTGKKVALIDFDVGLRNLDLVMGAERRVVFDLVNVTQGTAKLSQALIRDKRVDTLFLLPASQTRDKDALTEEGVAERHRQAALEKFDYVLCDSPAGIERGAQLAMRFADDAVIVTNPEVSSVRDSDRIIGLLDSRTLSAERGESITKHILVTRYDAARAARGEMLIDRRRAGNPVDAAARHHPGEPGRAARLQPRLAGDAERTRPTPPPRAYIDAARRLEGEDLPMVLPVERQGLPRSSFWEGGRHEPVRHLQAPRQRAGGARALAGPARL